MEGSISESSLFAKEGSKTKTKKPQEVKNNIATIIQDQTKAPLLAQKLGVEEFFKEVAEDLPNRADTRKVKHLKDSLLEIEETILDRLQEQGRPETKEEVAEYFDNLSSKLQIGEENIYQKLERILGALRVMQVQIKQRKIKTAKAEGKLLEKIIKNIV